MRSHSQREITGPPKSRKPYAPARVAHGCPGRACCDSTISEVAWLGHPSYVRDQRKVPSDPDRHGGSGGSARRCLVIGGRRDLPQMAVLEEIGVPCKQEP